MRIFTAKSVETLLAEGGTGRWRLDPARARHCKYAICVRNAKHDSGEAWAQGGGEPHHTAFLIGKIKAVVPAWYDEDEPENLHNRFLIEFSEYARIAIADAWPGGRQPVRYETLASLGIDPATLDWKPMPEPEPLGHAALPAPSRSTEGALWEAKKLFAEALGTRPNQIEITIRA